MKIQPNSNPQIGDYFHYRLNKNVIYPSTLKLKEIIQYKNSKNIDKKGYRFTFMSTGGTYYLSESKLKISLKSGRLKRY